MNTGAEVAAKVLELVASQFNRKVDTIEDGATWDDLNADSIDLIELVMSAEDEFHIEIPDEDTERLLTVGEFVRYVAEHCPWTRPINGVVVM